MESKRHSDGKSLLEGTQKDLFIRILFKDNDALFYAFKKTERIIAALYLVTNTLKDSEPLKWDLRTQASALHRSIGQLITLSVEANKDEYHNAIMKAFFSVRSLLEIAKIGGTISEMNVAVILREMENVSEIFQREVFVTLKSGAEDQWGTFFSTERVSIKDIQDHKGHIVKDSKGLSFRGTLSDMKRAIDIEVKKTNPVNPNKGHSNNSLGRQENILGFIRTKNAYVSIKDILSEMKDIGEKTVQRDLLAMVASGVLEKVGERRWSRYGLKGGGPR